ncbi:MAG TPA: hypothetical protein VKW04_16440 [Planctomycetota bacterium]|nr:hypothetical protein [Planctomycetota bacterium]
MRHWGVVPLLALAALSGCIPEDTWSDRIPPTLDEPEPPEHLLRKQADFRLFDPSVRKEFFLYFYEDELVSQEIVTVINHALPLGERRPRMATREEHDYAIRMFMEDWRARGQSEKIRYFNEKYSQEVSRMNTLLDKKIDYKEREIRDLDDKRLAMEADVKSRQMTGAFQAGDEKLNLVDGSVAKRELARAERALLLAQGQLMILEYLRDQRNAAYARHTLVLTEDSLTVKDLLETYPAPERLIQEICQNVQPFSWQRPGVRISIADGTLRVTQSREVVVAVRDYVERRRDDLESRKKAAKQ